MKYNPKKHHSFSQIDISVSDQFIYSKVVIQTEFGERFRSRDEQKKSFIFFKFV